MDISQIQYFVGVCDCGSMAKAAQKLHLSQQGLSVSIKRLENELGCYLFYRRSNGVVLTEAGEACLEEAKAILRHVDRIYDLRTAHSADKDGRFQISCAVADSLIVRLPGELQRLLISGDDTYNVILSEGYSSECVERVLNGKAMFAIVYGDWDHSKYDVSELTVIKQVWIVNKNHPWADRKRIRLAELDNVPICASDERSRPRQELDHMFEAAGVRLNVAFICNRPRVTVTLVSNNPAMVARVIATEITPHDLEEIRVLELEDHPFSIQVSLVYLRGRTLNIQERYFKRLITDSFRQDEAKNL